MNSLVPYNTKALAKCHPRVQTFINQTLTRINNRLFLDQDDDLGIARHASLLSIEQMGSALDSAIQSFNKRISDRTFSLPEKDTLETIFYKHLQLACISRERTANKEKLTDKEGTDGMANEAFLKVVSEKLERLKDIDRRYQRISSLVSRPSEHGFNTRGILMQHIRQLGDRCKDILVALYYNGLTHREIWQELKDVYSLNSEETERKVSSNCMKRLRESIHNAGLSKADL